MKKQFLCAVLCCFMAASAPSVAQTKTTTKANNTRVAAERDVPQAVRNEFNQRNPNMRVTSWERLEKDDKTMYKANFERNNQKNVAVFDNDGNWKKTKREVQRDQVPQAVWNSHQRGEHANWRTGKLSEMETRDHGMLYGIEVRRDNDEKKLMYSPDGTLSKVKDDD